MAPLATNPVVTAALMAASLAEKTNKSILVVEAGKPTTPFAERVLARERWRAYGESPWKQDHLDDQNATGTTWGFSPSMNVGGLAMHWGGVSPRYSPEDFRLRSMYGVGSDWPAKPVTRAWSKFTSAKPAPPPK